MSTGEESRKRVRLSATAGSDAPSSAAISTGAEGMCEVRRADVAARALADILSSVTVEGSDLPSSWLLDACGSLERLTSAAKKQVAETPEDESNAAPEPVVDQSTAPSPTELRAAQTGLAAAAALRGLASHFGPSKGQGRKALLSVSSALDSDPAAAIVVASALAVGTGDANDIALGRAAASAVVPNGRYTHFSIDEKPDPDDSHKRGGKGQSLGLAAVKGLLEIASEGTPVADGISVDLHIVTALSRAFVKDATPLDSVCAAVVKKTLFLHGDDSAKSNDVAKLSKSDAAPSLALAAQLSPFSSVSPVSLIERAVGLDLWHAGERLCDAALGAESADSSEAVKTLVDAAFDQHIFRQADAMATKFYDAGGRDRYAEARLEHACETIAKVVQKRQFPIIERQIERVDRAFERVYNDLSGSGDDSALLADKEEGRLEVRTFALRRLREAKQNDLAHRLANLYEMPYHYNAEDAVRDEKERREQYLQFGDVLNTAVPDAISTPDGLRRSFSLLEENRKGAIGFDVEWGDDGPGASLLQLSTTAAAILVDIPALSATEDGTAALEDTVGKMFAGSMGSVVGFGCQQDVSRLQASPYERGDSGNGAGHWLAAGTSATLDLRGLIIEDEPKLRHRGLSKVCHHYIGKPLDKAEQCSLWARRPLSMDQRAYAALDAWACAAIHAKLSCSSRDVEK